MTHGSLFSGIGGFDLAAEWMGWKNAFHCEWEDFPRKVLKYYWPNAKSYGDITKTDFTVHRGEIDIITGGFPCQPYSQAGKRLGKEDDRHLWPEMLRAIREIAPTWVVGENVRGLVNWNGGMVFDEVQADLEAEGYEVQPFLLPACGVNAPHRRDRIWFVAYTGHTEPPRPEQHAADHKGRNGKGIEEGDKSSSRFRAGDVTDTGCESLEDERNERGGLAETNQRRQTERFKYGAIPNKWENFPTQSPFCDGDDGFSSRLDGITFPKWQNESIKAGGNAIVPQIALMIFKTISKYEEMQSM